MSSAAWANDVDNAAYSVLTGVAGTNTVTATGPANYAYGATKHPLFFIPAATNTGATTINITPSGGAALGAKNVFWNGAACVGGELRIGVPVALIYDGTQFHIVANAKGGITLTAEQATTSGTEKDFTGIPAGVKRITVMGSLVSSNGTSPYRVQIGDAGGLEVTGYVGNASAGTAVTLYAGAGFEITIAVAAAGIYSFKFVLALEDSTDNNWIGSGHATRNNFAEVVHLSCGEKALTAVLDRVRFTTVNGTDAFDLGAISLSYE